MRLIFIGADDAEFYNVLNCTALRYFDQSEKKEKYFFRNALVTCP